ncbi:nuclear pore complex protein Nup160 [Dermatophagoides pteronyssinus]|uniref:nuclear pore complex protein Nup160 n=1 Tax=Dermatophagoides pteronyssinus TaxID=6956 RepID=UPI003F66BD57
MMNDSSALLLEQQHSLKNSMNDHDQSKFSENLIVINCASNSTLQDLKIPKCSGVFTYNDSDVLTSVTSNRYIVWQTYDDILELNEHSLHRDLHYNQLRIQFKNSLILQNGVSIQETADKIIILVTTIVSAHRLIFRHPHQLNSNPKSIGSLSCLGPSLSSSNDSPCYSIFYNVTCFDDSDTSFVQLQNSFSQNAILGQPTMLPYLSACSWANIDDLDAFFILSTTSGSLQIIRLPSASNSSESQSEIKIQTFDLKQSNLIGKLISGYLPSLNKSLGSFAVESAICLLQYNIGDDNLIFALCRDGRIRVISLNQQSLLLCHNIFNQSMTFNSRDVSSSDNNSKTAILSTQKPISMKFWWYENETYWPNVIVYCTDTHYNQFYFYQIILPNQSSHSPGKNHSINHHSTANYSTNQEPHLRYLFQRCIPSQYDLIDYFVCNSQLWAMWQHDEQINIQYYSIDTNYNDEQPFEWMPVVADVNAYPEIGSRSPLVNPREFYLNGIFWQGNFSCHTIAKAINVLKRSIGDEKCVVNNLQKIDLLIQEAIKLVDNIIRNQADCKLEMNVDEYIQYEVDAWNKLYQFCLDYHVAENEPLSIFVDHKTGIKGIVRRSRLEFIASLSPFDDMINHYFLHCKQNNRIAHQQNGDIQSPFNYRSTQSNSNDSFDLFSISAFEYRLNTLIKPIQDSHQLNQTSDMFSTIENMKSSILALLHGMSAINVTLKDEDLLDFEAFMQRVSSFSTETKLSLVEITKKITENSLLPEMSSLSDHSFVPLIDDFFEKCPHVVEAIKFFILQLSFDFMSKNELNDYLGLNNEMQLLLTSNNEDAHCKMDEALQFEIKPMFANLLSSQCGLNFTVSTIQRIIQARYKFCRDLFLLQYMLTSFHSKVKSDYRTRIIHDVQAFMIPATSQVMFALNHLNWISETPMITPNIWWSESTSCDKLYGGITSIVNLNTSPSQNLTGSNRGSSFENSELLSVLEMRDFINLNRVGLLSHESIFYDAYPRANILYLFCQFSGGILAKRLLSYSLTWEYNQGQLDQSTLTGDGIWSNLLPMYMDSICQLVWPFSSGQFKLAEFLLGIGQYHLVERFVDKLHPWCKMFAYSRYFARGICYLMTGEGDKAIIKLKQSVYGINQEPFLFKIFAQRPKSVQLTDKEIASTLDNDDNTKESDSILRKIQLKKLNDAKTILNARTLFRYYNKLIHLFNRYSTYDLVIELANCALKCLGPDFDPEFNQHSSILHSILFSCHLRLGNIDQAYKSMIDNLDPDQKQNCLRQFIVNLCENGQLKQLVSYPYIDLEDNFVSILDSKARSSSCLINDDHEGKMEKSINSLNRQKSTILESESSHSVNYFHILYSYFINTFNYRRAAQTIYDYYRQLNQEYSGGEHQILKIQANCLLIARNCLKCLDDSKYSWIVKNSLKKTTDDTKQQMKRKRGYFSSDDNDKNCNYNQDKTIIEIVDDEELLREYLLIDARLKLLERNSKEYAIASSPLSPDETVILCTDASLYEQSFKISELFSLPLEPIFDGMASKYVQLLNGLYNRRRIDDETMLGLLAQSSVVDMDPEMMISPKLKLPIDENNFSVDLFDIFYENTASNIECDYICYSSLSICDRMWYLIMYYLYRYQRQPHISTDYFKTVAEKLLSNGIMIPVSLMKIYQKSNCPQLLRLLMTYNFLTEATQLSIDYMNAFMGHGVEYFDLKNHLYPNCPPLCIPMHLFDCLAKILAEENERNRYDTNKTETEKWQKSLYSIKANNDQGDNDSKAVDDDDDIRSETIIDYDSLLQNLNKTKQKLEQTIISCSNI